MSKRGHDARVLSQTESDYSLLSANTLSHNVQRNVNYFAMQLQNLRHTVKVQLYACEKFMGFVKIWPLDKFMQFLFTSFCQSSTFELHWSCVSMLRSVFSKGSSLFSSKCCVSFTLSHPFCLHLFLCRMAAFANSVTLSPSACFFSCWQGHHGLEIMKQSHHQHNNLSCWRTLIKVQRYAWTYTWHRGWKLVWMKKCNYYARLI